MHPLLGDFFIVCIRDKFFKSLYRISLLYFALTHAHKYHKIVEIYGKDEMKAYSFFSVSIIL